MKILAESREHDKVEQYRMTMDGAITSMKNVEDGTTLEFESYLTYEDVDKKDGTPKEITAVMTSDKSVYAFTSPTFKASLLGMYDLFKDKSGKAKFKFTKVSGTSTAGRSYIDCVLGVE